MAIKTIIDSSSESWSAGEGRVVPIRVPRWQIYRSVEQFSAIGWRRLHGKMAPIAARQGEGGNRGYKLPKLRPELSLSLPAVNCRTQINKNTDRGKSEN